MQVQNAYLGFLVPENAMYYCYCKPTLQKVLADRGVRVDLQMINDHFLISRHSTEILVNLHVIAESYGDNNCQVISYIPVNLLCYSERSCAGLRRMR